MRGAVTEQSQGLDVFQHPDIAALNELSPGWIDAEAVHGVDMARIEGWSQATQLLEQRMDHLRLGEYDVVPQAVDPLTTAGRAVKAETQYGLDSEEYATAYHSLLVDSQRLLAEAWRKGTWEYFPPLEQPYERETEAYTFMGRSLLDMVSDGVTPVAEPEERQYRMVEFVEEKTYGAIRKLGKTALSPLLGYKPEEQSAGVSVNTISECADWAIEAYEEMQEKDTKRELGGYAPEIKKLMIRSVRYDTKRDVRYQEQLGVSGLYITHEVVLEAMRRQGVSGERELSKVEVRAKQMIDPHGRGVLEVVKLLDEVASEYSGQRIFLGEVIAEDRPKDYEAIPAESTARQHQLKEDARALTDYLIDLEKNEADHWVAGGLVENFVQKRLLEKVRQDPDQAAIVFDQKTSDNVRRYMALQASGEAVFAEQIWSTIEKEAPAPVFCGAGSCGLEKESLTSSDGLKAQRLGLKVDKDEEMLRDTERECPDCGEKKIYYASKSASKVCTGCGLKEIKSRVKA